ncbi:4-hydroxy-3-methylbut-2-enyl diphosphate reductase [Treponema sp. J25]|uniref:4-hydroxy-3-methylbut-2-enyl diphosphate reductase n=1 Tax=Treponema sp. J25 TaxID=2094121 RepID=UPI0010451490|nr:4-hydroxy-3-methylbut-2-enyl diphosphate reductase [Treponema sp. J25]TCW61266.1 4-hydroxy-3-methylbut-2-enyl diphosphate reductase [Treponema sp. J25]
MVLIRSRVCGYCMGVERAIKKVYQQLELGSASSLVTLGPLIHNPRTIESLKKLGVKVLDTKVFPSSLEGTTVVIRAHGVAPQVEEEIRQRGGAIVDATCPKVKSSQRKAEQYSRQGYVVFLAGDPGHGEIQGIVGYTPSAILIPSASYARDMVSQWASRWQDRPVVLMGQTTFLLEEYEEIRTILETCFPHLITEHTICLATKERQEALVELCAEVDAVIVVGGKNSANTRRLYELAKEHGKPAWHIEDPEELSPDILKYEKIGITAGASTPMEHIEEVERYITQVLARGKT